MQKIFKISLLLLTIGGMIFGFANKAAAQSDLPILVKEEKPQKSPLPLYVPDEIIVKFKLGADTGSIEEFIKKQKVLDLYRSESGEFNVFTIPKGKTVPELVEVFKADPLVEYAEPNYYAYAAMVPNDPGYRYQWHFDNSAYGGINMESAWNMSAGDPKIVVAVVDTGVAYEDYPAPAHWHIDKYKAYSGHSWWCGANTAAWVTEPGYGNGWKDYLQHSFDLTGAAGTVTLTYQYRHDLEITAGIPYDKAYTEISTDGGVKWEILKTYTGKSLDKKKVGWKEEKIDLTSYKGNNILLRFRFNSDELYSDEDGGYRSDGAIFIDEIRITHDKGILFEDKVESGPGAWETTKYQKAPDLAKTSFIAGYDFINNDTHPNDDNGHGTHVTGTIAQTTNNNLGAAGIAFKTTIMPVKVLNAAGFGTYQQVADGIYYAVKNGAKVINLSLGGPSPAKVLENAVREAYLNGVIVIAASGNNNSSSCYYPAAYNSYVIAVGATQYDETRAPYSNYGSSLDLVAPGGNTAVDQNGDGYPDGVLQNTFGDTPVDWGYWFYQGTSRAAAHVSGVAALLLAKNPALTPDRIRNTLQITADDLGSYGWDQYYGWGLVNAYAALSSLNYLGVSVTPDNWTIGPVAEAEFKQSGRFIVKNEGNVTETFSLGIEGPSYPSNWIPGSSVGNEAYVMKGLFGPTSGNPTGLFSWDDVIIMGTPSEATDIMFGDLSLTPNGAGVEIGGQRGLWFEFQAPSSTSHGGQEQSITVTVGAQ